MSGPSEIVEGIFSLVVSLFVFILIFRAISGGDISGIANLFVDIMPTFVVGLILLFFILKIYRAT